jgi:hypothetical protein
MQTRWIFGLRLPGWRWLALAVALVVSAAVATPLLAVRATGAGGPVQAQGAMVPGPDAEPQTDPANTCAAGSGLASEGSMCTTPECAKQCICQGTSKKGKQQNPAYPIQPNGCSVPDWVEAPLQFWLGAHDKDNPVGLAGCSFLDACNLHDYCYGTCNSLRATCDGQWYVRMLTVCRTSCPEREECELWASRYFYYVRAYGWLFRPSEDEVCQPCCCGCKEEDEGTRCGTSPNGIPAIVTRECKGCDPAGECTDCRLDTQYTECDEGCQETPNGPRCKEPEGPGGDHPDETYDVSSSGTTADAAPAAEAESDVAVLQIGFPLYTQQLLASLGQTVSFVGNPTPDLASRYPVLVIPTGGLYGIDSVPSFKSNLQQYVDNGGTLVVFAQQHGYEFNALPGGEVSGFGWLEDQACHASSVRLSTYHPILSGQDSLTADVDVDGYFTSYPDNATILLTRVKNGMPAMLMYEYGEGRVVATTAYTDWAFGKGQATQDGKNLVRDMLAWVKDPEDMSDYGASDTVEIPVDVTNLHLPVPETDYPQYEVGDTVEIPVSVTNDADIPADRVSFAVFIPDYDPDYVDVPVSVPAGETRIVDFAYQTTAESQPGVYLVLYLLYAGDTLIASGFPGGFGLGVDMAGVSTYEVNFTLADPDGEIAKQESVPVYVEPGQVESIDFTYANPSKLGIWSLEYEVRDYSDTLVDSGVKKFAVSNFADNPGGFAYQGPQLLIWATTPDDHVPAGSDVAFTVHVKNDSDSDFSGNIGVGGHEARQEGGRWWAYYGAITGIAVPAHSEASYAYSHAMDVSTAMYFGLFQEGVPYENQYFHQGAIAASEKGVWVFEPSIAVDAATDKTVYIKGEDVSISLDMQNRRSTAYDVNAVVRVLDPENYKLFENAFYITLPDDASDQRTFDFSLPSDAKYGVYVVTAEAFVGGEKVGSDSAYFEVRKGAIVRVNFDHPNRAYRAREGMTLVLEAISVVSSPWSSTVDISIPDLGFSDSVDFVLDPGQTQRVTYNLVVPAGIAVGKHDVTLTSSADSRIETNFFVVPESKLALAVDKTNYNAGEELNVSLTNVGGVDTASGCTVEFVDPYGLLVHGSSSAPEIPAGQSTALAFTLPGQLVSGNYYLETSCEDLSTGKVAELSKSIAVDGLAALLTNVTDKKAYFNDETISIDTEIANLGGEIIDGMLNLQIVRPVQDGLMTSLQSIPQRTEHDRTTPSMQTVNPPTITTGAPMSVAEEHGVLSDPAMSGIQTVSPRTTATGAPRPVVEPHVVTPRQPPAEGWTSPPNNLPAEHGCDHAMAADDWFDLSTAGWNQGRVECPDYPILAYGALANGASATEYGLTSEGSGSISGFVYEEDGVTPIEGATVKAADWDAQPFQFVGESTTNSGGAYVISGLGTGDYRVMAYAAGHAYELYQETYLWDEAQPVAVSDGQVTADIDFSLGPGGTISGTVTSADSGTPLAQVSVYASHADSGGLGAIALTDESGDYTITNLPYDTYYVQSPSPWRQGSGDDSYIWEYWQERPVSSRPDAVTVSEGVNPTGINFTLEVGGSISGVVRDEAGDPIAGVSVYASEYDIWASGNSQTAEDGSYTIHALPSGNYRVYAWAPPDYILEYYDGVYDSTAATLVPVTVPNDTSGISFVLEVGGSISGVVKDEAGDPIAGAWVSASEYDSGAWGSSSQTAEDGSYTVTGLPSGNYRVQAQAPDYIREYYDDVYDWDAATPVPVTVPSNTTDIDFTLELGGTISGVVKNEAGDPIQGALVYASEYDSGAWGSSGQTAEDGSYTITGLPSGSYRVGAWASDYVTEFYDNVYDSDAATAVSVTAPDATSNINFTLGPAGSISGTVLDQDTGGLLADASTGSIDLDVGWHKFVYRHEEYAGGQIARAAFKAPGDADWRWFSTSELNVRTSPDPDAESGILLTNKRNTWDWSPRSHGELVACVDADSTEDSDWYGSSVVGTVNQNENIHGNDEHFTSYYEGYFYVETAGTWYFSTDSDDASEIVVDDELTAYWYEGHGPANRWEQKVDIRLQRYDTGEWVSSTRGNADGSYIFEDLPAGSYIVQAAAPGYVSEFFKETASWDEATPVAVIASEDTTDINLTLELGGSISGVVRDETGIPIGRAWVEASEYDSGAWGGSDQTTEDGTYTILGLPSGSYRVQAGSARHARESYDNVYDPNLATPVVVTAPNDTPNVDFTLGIGATISGRVYQEDGITPMPDVYVFAEDYDTGIWMEGTNTGPDGSYSLVLPTGTYRVGACPTCNDLNYVNEYYDNAYHQHEGAPVSVTAPSATPNINFTLELGGSISGYVYQQDGVTPIPNVWVGAEDYDTGVGMAATDTNLDGSYTILGLPTGTYRVRACPSCSDLNYVSKWYDNTYHWDEATPVSVTAPDDTPGIDFALEVGGTISGHVYQEDGVTPLANVNVGAEDFDTGEELGNADTNPDGTYSIIGLPTGTYRVRACSSCSDLNYVSKWYDNTHHWDEASPMSVTAPDDTPGIDFALEVGGTVSGHVYQQNGVTPIPNVHVHADDYDTGERMADTDTNLDGSYTLIGLPTGTYRVRACPSCNDLSYVDEWYDNTHHWDEATPVSATAPDDTPGIDFALEVGGTVSGHVYQQNGVTPIPNVHVFAENYDSGVWVGATNTNLDGSYTILGVPTGTYQVRACPSCNGLNYVSEWYDDTYYENEATPVSVVAPSDTSDIDFTLEPGGTISGFVYQEDGITPIFNVRVGAEDFDTGEELGNADTNPDGTYTIVGLPTGTYRIEACASCSGLNYIDELYDDVYRWEWALATPVSVTSTNDTPDINFTLGVGGTVSGHVYQQDGVTPIPNVYVYADDYDTGEWMAATNTNLDGSYTILGLPTGTYQVRACPSCNGLNYVSEWYDDTYYENEATPVSVVAPSDTSDIDFTLKPGGSISGYVYQEDGVTPIRNVHVNAENYDTGVWMDGTSTSADGSYTILGLPTGTYRVRACPSCNDLRYVDEWYDNTYYWDEATPVSVTVPDDTPGIDFALEVGGTISGHVYQEDGLSPLANIRVSAEDVDTGEELANTDTNPDGSYTIISLPTGTYRVRACASCNDLTYVSEWYDNTHNGDEATPVSVTAPDDTPGIDFTLEIGGTISGRVYEEDGVTPIRNVHVYAEDYDTGVWMEGSNTGPDGSYSLVLPTGTYRVGACPSCNGLSYARKWYDNTPDSQQATPVFVIAPDDTPGIDFTLEVGGTISGTVLDEATGQPLASVSVDCWDPNRAYGDGAVTNREGHYTILGLPSGQYVVESPSGGRWGRGDDSYAREFYDGQGNANSADLVTISPSSPDVSGVNFTLQLGATISGRVYQEDGATPLVNVYVYADDYDTGERMAGTNTDPDGDFSLVLPSGIYRVRACPSCNDLNYVSKWYDNTFSWEEAIPVFATAPYDTPDVDFALEVGGTISGHVYQEDGVTPLPNVPVYAEDHDTGAWIESTATHADGRYSLVLPSGTYRVRACPSCNGLKYVSKWYDNTHNSQEATPVSVTAPYDSPGIDFVVELGGTISGYVYQEDDMTPIGGVHVYAEDFFTDIWMEGTNTRLDGSYSLVVPSGIYRVGACPSCNNFNYFDEWYDSTRNREEATPVSATAPNDTSGIDFTLVRPILTLAPSSGPVGTLVTVGASGLTPDGIVPEGGITFAGIPWNGVAIPIDSSGNMTPTTLAVPTVGMGPQTVLAVDSAGMTAEAIFTVTAVVWEETIPINLSVSEIRNIITNISIPSEMPNLTGKFNLLATLYSSSSQVVAQSAKYSLFVTDTDTSLTLETDKDVYKPSETVAIYGEVTNNAEMADDFSLSIRKDGEEIFADSFVLGPGESHGFATSTTSDTSFALEATVDGITIADSVRIERPDVNVTILAPDVVGLGDFDVGILAENVAEVDANVHLSMADEAWDLATAPGESRLVETTMGITQDTTLNVVVSGDVETTVQKQVVMGERATIHVSPQAMYLEGPVNIPFVVENTGLTDTEFEATFSIDGQSLVRAFYLPRDGSIEDALAVDLSKGDYGLEYSSPFEQGSVDIHVATPDLVVASAPDSMTLALGQDVVMAFVVENKGGAEGEANLRLTIPGIFEDTESAFVEPGEQQEISFNLVVPDDLEEKEYKAIYELDGVVGEFSVYVLGAGITVEASLDKAVYQEGETAVLTLTVTNDSDLDVSLYARVQLNDYEELQHFALTDSASLEFHVPVHFDGQKLFYGVYMESGRSLHLNSVYVHKEETVLTLYTDKQVYSTGETVTVFVDTTQSGTLNVVAPGYTAELPVDGNTVLSFTVPELRSGTYYIEYTFDGFASSYPFDVIGYSARIMEFRLDRERYTSGDTMQLRANVEVSRDVTGLLRIRLYDPQDNLIDEFEILAALMEGENKIETERAFSTDTSGIHALVHEVYGDLPGSSLVLLASGAEYFDGTAAVDTDGDGVPDADDNCPLVYNRDQANTDADLEAAGASVAGDSLGDECDDDDDNDEFDDDVETYLSTVALDNCACGPGPGGDAWPLDINMDCFVTVAGDAIYFRGHIGACGGPPADPKWLQRLDLNADNYITVTGDALLFRGMIGESCT